MVRRKKDQPPMKSHTIRMSDAEWAEMQRCAEYEDESDSEYIRKAIEMRNKKYPREDRSVDSTHKNNTVSKPTEELTDYQKQVRQSADKQTYLLKTPQKQVQSFPKGGGGK